MRDGTGNRHVILSGCSGGGKSTLLAELRRRGFATVEEPGRRIVAEEMRGEGRALPWVDLAAFARRATDLAHRDRDAVAQAPGWVFFDRGLVDAAIALEHAIGKPASCSLSGTVRFHRQVFLVPPWPEIYRQDGERQQDLAAGVEEYNRLCDVLPRLGYAPVILPRTDVETRADIVLGCLR
ncbi:AAA family ATPase [uncultured Mameliella sp.]|uniref:AAA family ATPase n=1 Tax=uncultured Mameliella sp. TaxID=1447087 RepID=UPI0026082B7A|nr:AAA family ATPase [uncultured Mameliella sp.]